MTSTRFEDLGISKDIVKAVRSVGWNEPTPVQAAAIPVGLQGKDLLAQAQTGTGKTGTYGSIILSRTRPGAESPTSLVLVPTRELAVQVSEKLADLSAYSGHTCIPIYGGVSVENQAKQIKKGVDIIVATPGRLKDLIERRLVSLDSVTIAVLDEADRMLDMGFAPSVNMILARVPKKRQTMMFSATMPEEVKRLAVKHMHEHEEILVSKDELTLDLTEQYYVMTTRDSKRDELTHLIENDYAKIIVFCRTKRKVDYLARKLKRDRYDAEGIHGDVGQHKREKIIKEFADGELQVLIASDVASRGLDIEDVDVVVNFDIPVDPETYVHRIGRTGRAGRTGKAITFVTAEDIKGLDAIRKTVGKEIKELAPRSELYSDDVTEEIPAKPRKQNPQHGNIEKEELSQKKRREAKQPMPEPAPVKGERTLKGKLDRKGEMPKKKAKAKEEPVKQPEPAKKPEPVKKAEPVRKPEPEPEPVKQPESVQRNDTRITYVPQGVPENPRPLHSYVGIVRAARPKKDMSFDRLELNIGAADGLDVDKLRRFVIDTAEINDRDVGNIHVSENKSRVQVVRYRAQEVVDELFGQVVNGKRVLIYNTSDKQ